jgi:hypothetical protein
MSLETASPHAATTGYTRLYLVNSEIKPLTEPCLRY